MEKYGVIEFECVHRSARFSGFVYADEIDDDEIIMNFYNKHIVTTHIRNAQWTGNEEDKKALYAAFKNDVNFLDFLAIFANKSKIIKRPGYILKIN